MRGGHTIGDAVVAVVKRPEANLDLGVVIPVPDADVVEEIRDLVAAQ